MVDNYSVLPGGSAERLSSIQPNLVLRRGSAGPEHQPGATSQGLGTHLQTSILAVLPDIASRGLLSLLGRHDVRLPGRLPTPVLSTRNRFRAGRSRIGDDFLLRVFPILVDIVRSLDRRLPVDSADPFLIVTLVA